MVKYILVRCLDIGDACGYNEEHNRITLSRVAEGTAR